MQFSREELELVSDPMVIDRKRKVIEHVIASFNSLAVKVHELPHPPQFFKELLEARSHKITRGENFHGYPFVLLDTPRLMNEDSPLAMRSLFWWGNHFSFHFMIRPSAWPQFSNSIDQKIEDLFDQDILLYMGSNCWEQNTRSEDFNLLNRLNFDARKDKNFLKLAFVLQMDKHENLEETACRFYSACLAIFHE